MIQVRHQLFTWIVDEALTPYMKAMAAYAGVNLILPADAWSCYPNLTPDLIDEWVVPYIQRLQGNLYPHGIYCSVPCGDYCEERLEKFDKQTLWRCFDAQTRGAGAPWRSWPWGAGRTIPSRPWPSTST